MKVLEAIQSRRSVRDYSKEAVPEKALQIILQAAQFAPTGINNRAVEFIVVRDPGVKERLFSVVGQEYVKTAPVVIVPAIDTTKSVVPMQDLSIANATMMYQAAALGLGTVWKHVQDAWQAQVKEILGVPAHFQVINLLPLGYPQTTPAGHSEQEFSEKKIHSNQW